jgi:hypothetical protein
MLKSTNQAQKNAEKLLNLTKGKLTLSNITYIVNEMFNKNICGLYHIAGYRIKPTLTVTYLQVSLQNNQQMRRGGSRIY